MHHLRHHKLLLPRGGGCGGNRVAALRGRLSFAFSGVRLACLHDGPANGRKSPPPRCRRRSGRSEEHTSELQSLMRISYAVFCLKKKKNLMKVITYIFTARLLNEA